MRLKRLATAAVCIIVFGGGAAVTPVVAKNDKPKKIKLCHLCSHYSFECETTDGGTVTAACPAGFELEDAFLSPLPVDLNGNLLVCVNGPLAVDDTPTE